MEEIKKLIHQLKILLNLKNFINFVQIGTENTNNFKFCVNCGNNLEMN